MFYFPYVCLQVRQYEVCVLTSDNSDDLQIGQQIHDYLSKYGTSVTFRKVGTSELDIPESKYVVFVMSKETLENDRVLPFCCKACAQEGAERNVVRIIPVLTQDVKIDEVPCFVNWITFLQRSNDNAYLDNLLQIVKGN